MYGRRALLCLICVLASAQAQDDRLSQCLRDCLKPVVKLQPSVAEFYKNYDKICERLEPAAYCSRSCGQEDHSAFHQLTTTQRLHCTVFEEELEDHLPCITKNIPDVEKQCENDCLKKFEHVPHPQARQCSKNECVQLCHIRQLSRRCPRAEQVLKKLHIERSKQLESSRRHEAFSSMPMECQNLHDAQHAARTLEDL